MLEDARGKLAHICLHMHVRGCQGPATCMQRAALSRLPLAAPSLLSIALSSQVLGHVKPASTMVSQLRMRPQAALNFPEHNVTLQAVDLTASAQAWNHAGGSQQQRRRRRRRRRQPPCSYAR